MNPNRDALASGYAKRIHSACLPTLLPELALKLPAEARADPEIAALAAPQHDSAIADLNQALRLDPKLANAYKNRGNAYKAKGEYAPLWQS